MTDKTYCAYMGCPVKSCDRHLSRLQNNNENKYVSICDFAPTCREYLTYVLEDLNNDR